VIAKSTVQATLGIVCLVLWTGSDSFAHEVLGVSSYYACQPTRARAFLRSPNPGAGNQDYPLTIVDAAGNPTGEHVVVITLQNSSDFDARVTAVGFAWPGVTSGFELVQLHRAYNELTTNTAGVRTGSVGPNDYALVPSLAIAQSHGDVNLSVRDDVRGVPGFPHTTLDFALVTGNSFSGGQPAKGLANDMIRYQVAFKGVLPSGSLDIESLLNDVYVRFRQVGSDGEGAETGIWRSLLPPVVCP
jgi:hypothetical protein